MKHNNIQVKKFRPRIISRQQEDGDGLRGKNWNEEVYAVENDIVWITASCSNIMKSFTLMSCIGGYSVLGLKGTLRSNYMLTK